MSSYKPAPDLKASTGPCRVFRIEKASGTSAGASRVVEIGGELRGSYAAFDGKDL